MPEDLAASAERFWSKVERRDGCWPFMGAKLSGYGVFSHAGASLKAHRVAYFLNNPDADQSLPLDHECHNEALARGECSPGPCEHRACCNPAHLAPKPQRDNTLLGGGPSAENARKVACPAGHPYSSKRSCPQCRGIASARWRAENPGWASERVPCSRCGLLYARRSIRHHEEVCGTPTRAHRERPGTVQHECGAWISRSNIARHRASCRGVGQRLPRRSRSASILTYFDEGRPDAPE